MAIDVTKLVLSVSNILLKDQNDKILSVLPSLGTYAHKSDCNENIIYLNDNPSSREKHDWIFPIDINLITIPAPPIGGWNQDNFLQELNNNFLGKFINKPGEPIYIKETDSKFADNTVQLNGIASATSFTLGLADLTRKQLIVVNTSSKKLWVSRNTPALVGQGIPLNKDEIYIEDVYRGAIYGIYESGVGNTFIVIKDTV